jgi:TolB protein
MVRVFSKSLFIVLLALCVAFPLTGTPPARAELNFRVSAGGQFTPMPIAVADFGGDAELGVKAAAILNNNLKRSGYFAPLPREKMPPDAQAIDAMPNFDVWRGLGVQALVTGRVTRDAGRIRGEFRLWDVTTGQQIAGQQYVTDAASWRRVGHIISDAVYTKITGIGAFFDTRIVYVEESGTKEQRKKRLAVMDQDGENVRVLSSGDDSVVSPRYSPVAQDITYMAQRSNESPRVHVLSLETGARQIVGNFPDMTSSPRFSPDGRQVALSLQQGGNANIYSIDLNSRATMRLTNANAIDTSPTYSPDGKQIAFESDRGGSQQIYVMSSDGSGAKRLSFGEGSYSQPAWSPRGDFIAFTRQKGGAFAIGIMKPDGSGERILTEGFHNEGPTWAPNGQYIILFRDPGGQSGGKLYMIDITGRVETPVPTRSFASDPSWSGLRK